MPTNKIGTEQQCKNYIQTISVQTKRFYFGHVPTSLPIHVITK